MKWVAITRKDLMRSMRSLFMLAFMFGIPLLVTGMFALMFGAGSAAAGDGASESTQLALVNLDQETPAGLRLGEGLAAYLTDLQLAGLVQVTAYPDAQSGQQAVDRQEANIAVIIPADFSAAFADGVQRALVQVYGGNNAASLVQSLLAPYLDGLASQRIAAQLHAPTADAAGPTLDPTALLDVRAPAGASPDQPGLTEQLIGPILAGMMIFFAFFTGCSSAQTILQENEAGTLARMMTTPTRLSEVLGGKFLATGLAVLVQVSLLLLAGDLLFHIQWGGLAAVTLTGLASAACAATFGIFATSLLKNTRQSGAVFGGLLTVTGMLGMMSVFTSSAGGSTSAISNVSLITPQGWAVRGLLLCMHGASLTQVLLNAAVLLALTLTFFTFGALRFRNRFA